MDIASFSRHVPKIMVVLEVSVDVFPRYDAKILGGHKILLTDTMLPPAISV